MNEILVTYDENGNATYTVLGENSQLVGQIVSDYFTTKGLLILDGDDDGDILIMRGEITAEEAELIYKTAEKDLPLELTANNVQFKFSTKSNLVTAPKQNELPPRLSSTNRNSGSPIITQQKARNTTGATPRVMTETEGFAEKPEPVKNEIINSIAAGLENYATKSNGKYKTVPSAVVGLPPRLLDTQTSQEAIIPQQQSNGELAFVLNDPKLASIVKNAFPPEQRFKITCGSPEAAELLIANMGGDPKKLTFDDIKEPKILEFKEQLKAKYPELKFTSDDGPSNSDTKKPKP